MKSIRGLMVGVTIAINGEKYVIVEPSKSGPGISTLHTGCREVKISPSHLVKSAGLAAAPKLRNDRSYLKRKKGRS